MASSESFDYLHDAGYHWSMRIMSSIIELILIYLFLHHAYRCYLFENTPAIKQAAKRSNNANNAKWRKWSHISTLITLFGYALVGGNDCINVWSLYGSGVSCDIIQTISVVGYHICKFCLFVVLVLRITVAFSDSTYYYDKVKIHTYFLWFILGCYLLTFIIGDLLETHGQKMGTDTMYYCSFNDFSVLGLVVFGAYDIIISIWSCTLFIWMLYELLKTTENSSSKQKYIAVSKKYAILTTIAILSTIILVTINSFTKIGWIILLDNLINGICILLMSSFYNKYYLLICCCKQNNDKNKTKSNSSINNMNAKTPKSTPKILTQPSHSVESTAVSNAVNFAISMGTRVSMDDDTKTNTNTNTSSVPMANTNTNTGTTSTPFTASTTHHTNGPSGSSLTLDADSSNSITLGMQLRPSASSIEIEKHIITMNNSKQLKQQNSIISTMETVEEEEKITIDIDMNIDNDRLSDDDK